MATKKYVSLSNLTSFLDNLKSLFATKTEINAKSDKVHTHAISDVSGLQTELNNKAPSSHGTHVTYSATAPLMDGTASVGTASSVSRSDHKHPTDTSRAAQTSLDSHTSNTTSHITSTERTNWGTSYTHSQSAHAPSNAEKNQNAFSNVVIGSTTIAADSTTDTLTLIAGSNITITPDATNDKITIAAKDTTYSLSSFGITATASEINKLDGVTATATEINYVDGVTSNIQTQLDNKAAKSHTHTVANISDLTATVTELNYMDGVKSSVQTQLDGKAASGHTHNYAGSSSSGGAATSANKLNTNAGSATQPVYFSNGVPVATSYKLEKSVPSDAKFTDTNTHYSSKNVVGATSATSNTATALTNGNVYINSVENGAVTSSHKISGSGATTVTTDANGNIVITSTDNNTTYSAAGSSLGLVKSGGDVTISSGVITVNDDSHNHTIANVDNLQSSLDAKQATITGGATTIASSNLTANMALISNGSGKVAVSAVTSTELGYLDGVTSNVQTQLDGKENVISWNAVAQGLTWSRLCLVKANIGVVGWSGILSVGFTRGNVVGNATFAISASHSSTVHITQLNANKYSTFQIRGVTDSNANNTYIEIYDSVNSIASGTNQTMYCRFIPILGCTVTKYTSFTSGATIPSGYTASSALTVDVSGGSMVASKFVGSLSGNATTATNVAWSGVTSKPSYYDAKAIKSITRSGTTFTYTCMDGTTGTFTQQDNNTDTKVTNTLATTTKAYVTGTTSASTNTGTQVFDTGVYLDTTAGQLTATTFNGTTYSGSGVATVSEVKTYLGI